jgi:hypothetical protein
MPNKLHRKFETSISTLQSNSASLLRLRAGAAFRLGQGPLRDSVWVGSHGDVDVVRSAFCCVHVGRSCRRCLHLRVHWQTTRLLRYLQGNGQGVSLRVPASHRQP